MDLDYVVFQTHSQVLSQLIAAGPEPTLRVDPNYHQLFIGNDTLSGGAGDDMIVGDQGTLVTPWVTGLAFDQVALGSSFAPATWIAARAALSQQATARASELAAHEQHDQVLGSLTITPEALAKIAWDYDFALTLGNDLMQGDAGNDVLVGDFGILVMPLVLHAPQTSNAARQRDYDVQQLLFDVGTFIARRHHQYDDHILEQHYTHPYYAHRGGAAQEVTIQAGNDSMYGDAGNDFLLGDSLVLSITYQADQPAVPVLQAAPDVLRGYLWQEDYELAEHYRRDGGVSQISNDWLYGGDGNDRLYGQHRDDHVYGEGGDDVVYGGNGQVDVVDGGPGTNDVRIRGDDWPNLKNLADLQAQVFQTASTVLQNELRKVSTPPTVLGSVPRTAGPTSATSLTFTVTFGEFVLNVDPTDFQLTRTGTAFGTIASVTPSSGASFTVTVSNLAGNGTLRLDLKGGTDVRNAAGIVAEAYVGGRTVMLDRAAPLHPWQNLRNAYDVNNDNRVTPLDVLLIINSINAHGPRSLFDIGDSSLVDANGDDFVTALDALLVISFLDQAGPAASAGEGEAGPAALLVEASSFVLETPIPAISYGPPVRLDVGATFATPTPAISVQGSVPTCPTEVESQRFDEFEDLLDLLANDVAGRALGTSS